MHLPKLLPNSPKPEQQELLRAYFDKDKGIGYTLARTTIHSCDFSSGSYTYVSDNDTELKSFSVAHDEQYRIPFIKQAIAAAGGKLTMYVSPWSPPSWMKDNNSLLQGGKLKPESRQQWANYYVKFIKTYEAKGIPHLGLVSTKRTHGQTKMGILHLYGGRRARLYQTIPRTHFAKAGIGQQETHRLGP